MPLVDRPADSEHVLDSVRDGQQAPLQGVRKVADTVAKSLPLHDEEPSKRQKFMDAAFEMADRLVRTRYDFLRTAVRSVGQVLGTSAADTDVKPG